MQPSRSLPHAIKPHPLPLNLGSLLTTLEMLSSLRRAHDDDDEEEEGPNRRQQNQPQGLLSSPAHARRLLISCAELVHRSDIPAARHAASLLSAAASPYGDSTDRLIYQFTRVLSLRLDRLSGIIPSSSTITSSSVDVDALQSSYLSLNQVTPFVRFAHLTANQAILEAVYGCRSIHILDFDTSHGVQWPPFLQALAERSDPPSIRITGTGTELGILLRTGDRLRTFAHTLGIRFQFHPLLLPSTSTNPMSPITTTTSTSTGNFVASSIFQLHSGETLAVNGMLFLHKLLNDEDDGSRELKAFLAALRAMNPVVVAVAEREASHNSPIFLQRFISALDYYAAVFESLEATLPPNSRERLAVEQVWLGREIADVVAGEGEGRRERHELFERWEGLIRGAGFTSLPLSPFALSQARLLLRLHYPSEGYKLQMAGNSFFLGWQNKPLFSVSSWH